MTCHRIEIAGGKGWGIVCMRGRARRKCRWCGRDAERQCDYALRGKALGRTCDAYMCRACSTQLPGRQPDGETIDYCPAHAKHAAADAVPQAEQLTLEGLKP